MNLKNLKERSLAVQIEYIYFELNHLPTLSFTTFCLIVFLHLMRKLYDNYSKTLAMNVYLFCPSFLQIK